MLSCRINNKEQNAFTWKKNLIKDPAWQQICLSRSHKAFQINNKRLAKRKHAQVWRLRPGPQSRQPIVLSLFFLLWWSVVLNSWHISPHILTSKIAFCQYEGKDSFGFNHVRQLMSSIRTIENNHNVYNRLSVRDGFPAYMNEWGTSLVQMACKHPSKWKLQEDVGKGMHMTTSAQVHYQAASRRSEISSTNMTGPRQLITFCESWGWWSLITCSPHICQCAKPQVRWIKVHGSPRGVSTSAAVERSQKIKNTMLHISSYRTPNQHSLSRTFTDVV